MAVQAASRKAAFSFTAWRNRLVARPGFQRFVGQVPGLRALAKRDGAALFQLVQGFVGSQVLYALTALDVPEHLMEGPCDAAMLAPRLSLSEARTQQLLQAGAALGVLKRQANGRFTLTRQGAALHGVPGLKAMILHHAAFYRDMADPVSLLRNEVDTELAAVWPYVLGATTPGPTTELYSELMAQTAAMVAEDTLNTIRLDRAQHVMDVGGGRGAFLTAVRQRYPALKLTLFDLPAVAPLARACLGEQACVREGSFKEEALPEGADTITLIRVLYDHSDETVQKLLTRCHAALPPGGRLIISEPMSGGANPDPITDVYFAFYTMAMRTGCTRSPADIRKLCEESGFKTVTCHRSRRSYVTSVISAIKAN